MKVVINVCVGGFRLSHEAEVAYAKRKGLDLFAYEQTKHEFRDGVDEYTKVSDPGKSLFVFYSTKDFGLTCSAEQIDAAHWYPWHDTDLRTDPDLIAVIEELGPERASGDSAGLKIVEVPDPFVIGRDGSRDEVISKFRAWVVWDQGRNPGIYPDPRELRGKDLACWCRHDQPCHADALLELANK